MQQNYFSDSPVVSKTDIGAPFLNMTCQLYFCLPSQLAIDSSRGRLWVLFLSLLFVFCTPLWGQSSPLNPFQTESFSERIRLDDRQLILLILENYDEVALQQLALPKSDSDLLRSRAPYTANFSFGVKRTVSNPRYANSLTSVPPLTQDRLTFSYKQLFLTGTTVETGLNIDQNSARPSSNPLITSLGNSVFTPSSNNVTQIFVSVRQELLQNAFGHRQVKQDRVNLNKSIIQRQEVLNRLASLIVETTILFWEYYRMESNAETSQRLVNNVRNVKRVTRRKLRLGLAERFEVDLWIALEKRSENLLADVVYGKEAQLRALLSNLKLDKNLQVSFAYILRTSIPENLNVSKDTSEAFKRRADFQSAQLRLVNAKENVQITKLGGKPSLSLGFRYGSLGYDPSFSTAFSQSTQGNFPDSAVDLTMTAPLNDLNNLVDRRNAKVDLRIAQIKLEQVRRQVEDDVAEAFERIKVQHKKLTRTKDIVRRTRRYYAGILRGYRTGRFAATNIREALDSLAQAELDFNAARIDFNIILLRYDLACNRIFEKYGIDIDRILEEKFPSIGALQ